ncbi:MAG TPA: MFS transporter, partial [Actinomycetota bacterium]
SGSDGRLIHEAPPVPARIRPAVAIQVLFVLFGLVIASFFPFFAPFLEERGLSESEIGLVIAAMALARVLTNPVWGHVADTKIGRRSVLQLAAAGATVAALILFWWGDGLAAVVITTMLLAATSSTVGPNIDALALAHLGEERMTDYGRIRAWESLSYAAACLALGFVLQATGIQWMLTAYAAASLALLGWSFSVARDRPQAGEEAHGRLGSVGAVFREAPRFWAFLAASMLVWVAFSAAWNFISLKILAEGGGPRLIGFGTALGGLMEVPTMRLSSRLAARVGLRLVFVAGCVVYGTGFLLWGLISNPTIVSMLTVFEGAGFALLFTSTVVIVGRLVPPRLHSTGQSIASTVGFGVSPILGGAIGGVVFQRLGPEVLYVGACVFALGAGALSMAALNTSQFRRPAPVEGEAVGAPPFGSGVGLPPSEV